VGTPLVGPGVDADEDEAAGVAGPGFVSIPTRRGAGGVTCGGVTIPSRTLTGVAVQSIAALVNLFNAPRANGCGTDGEKTPRPATTPAEAEDEAGKSFGVN
jgi:hypothetical protein